MQGFKKKNVIAILISFWFTLPAPRNVFSSCDAVTAAEPEHMDTFTPQILILCQWGTTHEDLWGLDMCVFTQVCMHFSHQQMYIMWPFVWRTTAHHKRIIWTLKSLIYFNTFMTSIPYVHPHALKYHPDLGDVQYDGDETLAEDVTSSGRSSSLV